MSHSTCKGSEWGLGVITSRALHSSTAADAKVAMKTEGLDEMML